MHERIYLSPPHLTGNEEKLASDVFASNWLAPLGPHVDAFEAEFAARVGSPHALALSSGTAALHLALIASGIEAGDEVVVSTLTFAGSVNPILYVGAKPIFVDSELASWNMDPTALEDLFARRKRIGRMPRCVVIVHLYGQTADMDAISAICDRYGVLLLEDAAEALGATHRGRAAGAISEHGIFSFNGNKIITTSGGGMLVSRDRTMIDFARKLSTQAREPAAHYEHKYVGYNYRLSNLLAAVGRAQLAAIDDRVAARRANFAFYEAAFADVAGLSLMPEADWGQSNRWLTVMLVDAARFGATPEQLRLALEAQNIEARPVWKPMHLQPVYAGFERVGGAVAESLFANGICLPSGSSLTQTDLDRVATAVRAVARDAATAGRP